MRNKIIMIAAMLAVMVAMTGIAAAAYSVDIVKSTLNIGNSATDNSGLTYGTSVIGDTHYSVRTDAIGAGYNYVQACSETILGAGNCPSASLVPILGSTGWVTTNTYSPGFYSTIPDINLKIYAKGTKDAKIFVHINEGKTYSLLGDEAEAIATANVAIPEFPTVALPIAAVIGLVFFFQQRKKKEE